MIGTFVNVFAILLGGSLGLLFGGHLPRRVSQTVVLSMGLFTCAVGIQMFLQTKNAIIVLMSLLVGGLLGEWWRIEDGLHRFGVMLEKRFAQGEITEQPAVYLPEQNKPADPQHEIKANEAEAHPASQSRFLRGFLTASLLFCIGPMAILGSIQAGASGNYNTLIIKSTLDGFASIAFASALGAGVLFSSVMILIYQGAWTLTAAQAQAVATPAMMNELTAVGGVLLIGISISSLLEIKPIRVANLLPALLIAPVIVAFVK